jgi:hypothetical protein
MHGEYEAYYEEGLCSKVLCVPQSTFYLLGHIKNAFHIQHFSNLIYLSEATWTFTKYYIQALPHIKFTRVVVKGIE